MKLIVTAQADCHTTSISTATQVLELDAGGALIPVQVIIYTPEPVQVIDTTGQQDPGGVITITLPDVPPPPANTPIQIILYDGAEPTVIEGLTTPPQNGVFGIGIPEGLVD